jgi:cytochrome c peroxidase
MFIQGSGLSYRFLSIVILSLAIGLFAFTSQAFAQSIPTPLVSPNPNGMVSTVSTSGSIDLANPFFKKMGTNGRTCLSCHVPSQGWSISPPDIALRFLTSFGTDPIFRPVDGAVCPSAKVATVIQRVSAYRLLLKKGLLRISLPVPAGAQFSIVSINDPYSCPETTTTQPALYRRPLPSTNLPFLATVMWDGRETFAGESMNQNLTSQASDATTGHAQAMTAPSPEQLAQIVSLESSLVTAQTYDKTAGALNNAGASGGPDSLPSEPFFLGINDPLGGNPSGAAFNPNVFDIYNSWMNLPGNDRKSAARRSIARGEALFNTFPISLTGVAGLNDALGQQTVKGTCSTCHDAPNTGGHSLSLALNIGITDYPGHPGLDISGLPVYTVQCNLTNPPTIMRTTDLGRAMVTGKCSDVGKTKGPILRGLSARAPYFNNGSAGTLNDVVTFYNMRFGIGLTVQQQADLVAFLKSL